MCEMKDAGTTEIITVQIIIRSMHNIIIRNNRTLDSSRYDKCSGYPSVRQKQEMALCSGCGDFCHKCEYGVVISNACGVPQCAKASA